MIVSPVIAQPPPPDLPEGYYQNAYMGDDADVEQQLTFQGAFWQIVFDDEIKDCIEEHNISFFTIMTIAGTSTENGPISPINIGVTQGDWNSSYELNVQKILEIANLDGNPGTYFVSHMTFHFMINGIPTGNYFYPGDNIPILTGLPAPCDCLQIYFDKTNNKLYVGPGYCNLLKQGY